MPRLRARRSTIRARPPRSSSSRYQHVSRVLLPPHRLQHSIVQVRRRRRMKRLDCLAVPPRPAVISGSRARTDVVIPYRYVVTPSGEDSPARNSRAKKNLRSLNVALKNAGYGVGSGRDASIKNPYMREVPVSSSPRARVFESYLGLSPNSRCCDMCADRPCCADDCS